MSKMFAKVIVDVSGGPQFVKASLVVTDFPIHPPTQMIEFLLA